MFAVETFLVSIKRFLGFSTAQWPVDLVLVFSY
jgi:hypothetical protein